MKTLLGGTELLEQYPWRLATPGPKLSDDDIVKFEREIGRRLPDAYRQFLLHSNGGFCEPEVGFMFRGELHEVPMFDYLLANKDEGMRRGLSNLIDIDVNGYLPFSSNMNEDNICFSLDESDNSVWFAINRHEDYLVVGADVVPLANSFSEFLSQLKIVPSIYCPIEELGKADPSQLADYL